MNSYRNKALVGASAFLKLNVCNISCGTFTGKWSCTLPFNRLIYVFRGSDRTSCISDQNNTFQLHQGNWIFIPAGIRSTHEQYEGIELISLHFNLELITGIEYMQGCSGIHSGTDLASGEGFRSLMSETPSLKEVFLLRKLIWDFSTLVMEMESGHLTGTVEKLAGFQVLFDEFNRLPYNDFSVADMAKIMKMGRESFIKHFSAQLGVSPKLFFHRLRAAAAAKELLATNDTIRTIARRFNFHDEFYFSRFMKKMTGLSPREYRKKMSFGKE